MLTIEQIKAVVTDIAPKYGVERVMLFGSYARGDATEKSDVDLRIDPGNISGYFQLGGFYSDLEENLKTHIDLLTTDSLDEKFLNIIRKEEVVLYE